MAAETSSLPVNGNYAAHQGLGTIEQQNSYAYANNGTAQVPPQPPPASTTPASVATSQAELSKDEVGWYFVEQYYTTLSRNPERLYLFYNKRSQFVSGQEADKVRVYGGQTAINSRIKELEFKDCKVRVTNVDAQASESNIVIQVIGEMSNKSQPHKKFVQTFVLATQTNGYFVLNDIFRYLVDEEEELGGETQAPLEAVPQAPAVDSAFEEPPPTPAEGEQKGLTSSDDPVEVEQDAQELDRELEEKVLQELEAEEKLPAAVNGVSAPEAEVQRADDAPAAVEAPAAPVVPLPKDAASEVSEKVAPAATPAAPKQAAQQPAAAPKPAAPKSWAALAASANKVATPTHLTPATPDSSAARSTAASTKTATPPASTPAAGSAPSAPTAPAAQREESAEDAGQGDEWTAVGGTHTRGQSRQPAYAQQDGPNTRLYIKNVPLSISTGEMKTYLEQYGKLVYYDRPGEKLFVQGEYEYPEAFAAAVAANPHTLNGNVFHVEVRNQGGQRPGYPAARGRGNGPPGQPRGNFQGRGGFPNRGRGGNGPNNVPRGRGRGGAAQAA